MFTANKATVGEGFEISEADADGIGQPALTIYGRGRFPKAAERAEAATRLIVLALNMDGGLDRAVELLRAETVRQRA